MVRIRTTKKGRGKLGIRVSPASLLCIISIFSILFFVGMYIGDYSPETATTKKQAPAINKTSGRQLKTSHTSTSSEMEDSNTIAYVISVTGCGSSLSEGAAVLKHSIHLASAQSGVGHYGYKMYAIVHPEGMECGLPLAELGYEILERDTPVAVEDIEGEYLRTHITKNGCCGEKELIKLEAYTLVDHPVVVHLDVDTLVLQPLDQLFDLMLSNDGSTDKSTVAVMWKDEPIPQTINAFFTRDYNMVNPGRRYKPVQGGFLVLRPSLDTYQSFCNIIREGDFRPNGGWGGKVGPFYGSMTFQGLIPYYYDYLNPGTSVELNRCVYNQMCDNPRDQRTIDDVVHGNCRTGEDECEDCRSRPLEDVITVHYTLCQKPWWCLPQGHDRIQERLCRKLHGEWYRIRSELEISWNRNGKGPGQSDLELFRGYCSKFGKGGYIPIEKPYGLPGFGTAQKN